MFKGEIRGGGVDTLGGYTDISTKVYNLSGRRNKVVISFFRNDKNFLFLLNHYYVM